MRSSILPALNGLNTAATISSSAMPSARRIPPRSRPPSDGRMFDPTGTQTMSWRRHGA
jgi:hypothetical protein